MIDVTATMLPRTVRNERSLLLQMAWSAMSAASRNWFKVHVPSSLRSASGGRPPGRARLHLDCRAVGQIANRAERTDDDLLAFLQTGQHLEIFLAGDPVFTGTNSPCCRERRRRLPLPCASGRLQFRAWTAPDARGRPVRSACVLADDLALLVLPHLTDGRAPGSARTRRFRASPS